IFSADDAWEKITAGASLIQIYTALVYEGPGLAKKIVTGLREKMEKTGCKHLREAVGVIVVSLGIGMTGYHWLEKLPWIDAFLNAAMILSGMGPVASLQTSAGKLFAGCYALYSGIALISILGIIFAPVIHRFLHKFHLEDEGRKVK
ncbi:MAG: hypothetical protein ABSF34_12600, partial [Verrucomicrobiota bacterium]